MEASLSELYTNVTYQMEDSREISSDNSGDNSPSSTTFAASISSPKRRRAVQKRVVTFPLKEVEGSRFKGDCTPPSDSWAWRKYGQKPIKGSPYPRGYYRCSSSKGCPARKQVERSRSDPNTLVVTYSYEHNHPWPISRNNHQQNRNNNTTTTATTAVTTDNGTTTMGTTTSLNNNIPSTNAPNKVTRNKLASPLQQPKVENMQNNNNTRFDHNQTTLFQQNMEHQQQQHQHHHHEAALIPPTDELTWLASDHHMLDNNSFFNNFNDLDMAKIFPMREEDESLFADLGELPECSVVFRKAAATGEECNKLATTATWCGTTG